MKGNCYEKSSVWHFLPYLRLRRLLRGLHLYRWAKRQKLLVLDCVLSVGKQSHAISTASGVGEHFSDKTALIARLKSLIAEQQVITILVKGSRSAAMEEVVRALQENGTC